MTLPRTALRHTTVTYRERRLMLVMMLAAVVMVAMVRIIVIVSNEDCYGGAGRWWGFIQFTHVHKHSRTCPSTCSQTPTLVHYTHALFHTSPGTMNSPEPPHQSRTLPHFVDVPTPPHCSHVHFHTHVHLHASQEHLHTLPT